MRPRPLFGIRCVLVASLMLPGVVGDHVLAQGTPEVSADVPLLAELSSITPPVRIGLLMPTLWDIHKRAPGILEGHFEFTVRVGSVICYLHRTEDVVIHQTGQRFKFLLPPVSRSLETPEIEIDVVWVGKRTRETLRPQLLRVPFNSRRNSLMLVGELRRFEGRSSAWDQRLESLKLESLIDGPNQDSSNRLPALQTVQIPWDAELFPTDPLEYTAYDSVAIAEPIFVKLQRRHLDALLSWVRAGGRLYLEPGGLLEPSHLAFLNELTAAHPARLVWQQDRTGRLEWPGGDQESGFVCAADFGRCFVSRSDNGEALDPRLIQSYWRIPGQVLAKDAIHSWGRAPISNSQFQLRGTLEEVLMPASVRVVPLWLIATLLGGLVLAIGPLDWIVLGRLRQRRMTWLTWPAATLAVTVLTIWISNSFLRATDRPRTLVIHDYGHDGRRVRTNQFDLVFYSRSDSVESQVEGAVWRRIGRVFIEEDVVNRFNPGLPFAGGQVQMRRTSDGDDTATAELFTGRVPVHYAMSRQIRQWTPALGHQESIPLERQPVTLDWSRSTARSWIGERVRAGFAESNEVPPLVTNVVRQQLGQDMAVMIMDNRGRVSLSNDALLTVNVQSAPRTLSDYARNTGMVPLVALLGQVTQNSIGLAPPDGIGLPVWASLAPLHGSQSAALVLIAVRSTTDGYEVHRWLLDSADWIEESPAP